MTTETSEKFVSIACAITGIALWAFLWIEMGGALMPPIA